MKSAEIRRDENNRKIKSMGIGCYENLPLVESSEDAKLKSLDEICLRAIASLLVIQLACDAMQGNLDDEGKEFIGGLLEKYGVSDKLNSKEKKFFDDSFEEQDIFDVGWTYEAYWSLAWALGLVDDISDASEICDGRTAISFVMQADSFEEFKNNCRLRDVEDILDMLDLFYRYHWATEDNRINGETPIGDLNPSIVSERRRGLEWLFSEENDWFDISLDT